MQFEGQGDDGVAILAVSTRLISPAAIANTGRLFSPSSPVGTPRIGARERLPTPREALYDNINGEGFGRKDKRKAGQSAVPTEVIQNDHQYIGSLVPAFEPGDE